MKKVILITALILTGLSFQTRAQDYYDRGYDDRYNYGGYNNDGFGYFYTTLSPYGTWIEFGDGVYGWRPVHMRTGWAPYANGRWLWTSDGWYWDSYEPFGYIVYHYGRWYYDNYYGWVWIPDYQWAPAWVEWRYDNAYIGWAPLPPYAVFSISIGIHFTYTYYTPYAHWHFVKYRYFCDPYVIKYYAAPKYKYRIYSGTRYRNDYGYRNGRVINRGIDVNLVRKRGNLDIRERKIRTVSDIRDINGRNRITNSEIRTFIPDRNNFSGAKVRDMKIDRTTRNTSLETSRLEFGRKNLERKQTPELRGNDQVRTDSRINKDMSGQSTKENRAIEQKKVIPDTRTNKNERKEVKKSVILVPEKRNTKSTVKSRSEAAPKVEKRTNERIIEKKPAQQREIKTATPPVQKKTEVRSSRQQNNNRESTRNSGGQKRNDNGKSSQSGKRK